MSQQNEVDPPRTLVDLETCQEEYDAEVQRVLRRLRGMRDEDRPSLPDQGDLLPIDERRGARAFLIDGPRGSGKSTLLLCLLKALKKEEGLHPIALLDLENLAPAVPLAAHVVSSLHRLAGSPLYKDLCKKPLSPEDEEELDRDWRRLHESVARGSHSNLGMRGGKLDPADYVWALEDAARETLELKGAFRTYMKTLSEKCSEKPLFIIAIDDADMHPDRVTELIALVRVFWAPELAFIATGDVPLFLEGLEKDFAKRLGADGSSQPARQLARDAFHKYFPPEHRLERSELAPQERWKALRQELEGVAIATELETLGELWPTVFEAIPAHHRPRGDFAALLRRLVQEANGAPLTTRGLSRAAFGFAVERGSVPDYVVQLVDRITTEDLDALMFGRSTRARLVYEEQRTKFDIFWHAPEDLQAQFLPNADTRDRKASTPEVEQWPGLRQLKGDLATAVAAFRSCIGQSSTWITSRLTSGHGPVCARIPEDFLNLEPTLLKRPLVLVDEIQSDSLFVFSACASRSDSKLAVVRALLLALAGHEQRQAIFEAAAGSTSNSWDDEWQHFMSNGFPEEESQAHLRALRAGLMATLPESGLEAEEANALLHDLQKIARDEHWSGAAEWASNFRLRRLRLRIKGEEANAQRWLRQVDDVAGSHFDSVRVLDFATNRHDPTENELRDFWRHVPSDQIDSPLISRWNRLEPERRNLQHYFTDDRIAQLLLARGRSGPASKHSDGLLSSMRNSPPGRGLLTRHLQDIWEGVGRPGLGY